MTLLVFIDDGADAPALGEWLLLDGDAVAGRGAATQDLPAAGRTVLAVPGDQVSIHWLELADGLAPAQAAAAARLMLGEASAEPMSNLHVAIGRPEGGRTPAALVPLGRMTDWLAAAAAAGVDPEAIVPGPVLLTVPEAGFVRRDRGPVADYRAPGAAFTLEPELAEALVGDAPVGTLDEAAFEAAAGRALAAPLLDLRQGPFGRRRHWRVERQRLRRVAIFAIALALLTLAVQVATILSYTFAADRLQAEADALAAEGAGGGSDAGPGFGAAASALFSAVRATPQAEISGLDYRPDGTLVATISADSPATLAALQERIGASGLSVTPGESRTAGGRLSTELILRAA